MNLNPPNPVPETEIDFLSLVKIIWTGRRVLQLLLLQSLLAGGLVYLLSPSAYTATTKLPLLTYDQQGIKEENLGFTINYGATTSSIADLDITRETYTTLLYSQTFKSDLTKVNFYFGRPQKQGSLIEYYSSNYRENPLLKYTVGLPKLLSAIFQGENSSFTSTEIDQRNQLSTKQIEVQNWILNQIRIELNKRESTIEFVCTLPEASAAVQLTKIAAELLQFKVEKIVESNQYYSLQQVKKAKLNYDRLRHRLDSLSNINLGNTSFASKEAEKEVRDECAIAQSVYFELAKKRQLSEIQFSADKNIPQIIQSQNIAVKKSSAGLFLTLLIGASLGLIAGTTFVLGRKSFNSLKNKWNRV